MQRNSGFDILKSICAFLVVCIHAPFVGKFGGYFTALARIAVPIFFMITGFYYTKLVKEHKERKQLKKLFFLMLKANLFFFLINLFVVVIGNEENILSYLQKTFTVKALLKFLFFNESPFYSHLWYLGAILYVLIILIVCDRLHLRKFLYLLIPLLLVEDLVFGKYSLIIWGTEFPYILVRNFLFVGLPYFGIGMIISEKKEQLEHFIRKWWLYLGIIIFSVTTIVERRVLIYYELNATRDHYISTTFLAITVFILFMMSFREKLNGFEIVFADIGKKYATSIYIVHPILIIVFSAIWGENVIYRMVRPIIIYICSVVVVKWYQDLLYRRKYLRS